MSRRRPKSSRLLKRFRPFNGPKTVIPLFSLPLFAVVIAFFFYLFDPFSTDDPPPREPNEQVVTVATDEPERSVQAIPSEKPLPEPVEEKKSPDTPREPDESVQTPPTGEEKSIKQQPKQETENSQHAAEPDEVPPRKDFAKVRAVDKTAEGSGSSRTQTERYYSSLTDWRGEDHWIEWTVDIPADGTYVPSFVFATSDGPVYRSFSINGEIKIPCIEFPDTGGWGREEKHWRFLKTDAELELDEGRHLLRMTNQPPSGCLHLARIYLAPPDYRKEDLLLRDTADAPTTRINDDGPVSWRTDFECGFQFPAKYEGGTGAEDDPLRLAVQLSGGRREHGFFLFRLDGVAGKAVEIELRGRRNWRKITPFYAWIPPGAEDSDAVLADPELYRSERTPVPEVGDHNLPRDVRGTPLPVTRERRGGRVHEYQRWHYIPDVAEMESNIYRIRHTFCAEEDDKEGWDSVFVTIRYPYTPLLAERIMDDLRERSRSDPELEVFEIGRSRRGRPLHIVRIGRPGRDARVGGRKPVIFFYAREHPDEHDSSWAAQGVIDFLLSDDRGARAIRERFVVLVAPMLDPDIAAISRYEGFIHTFTSARRTHESETWARWFQQEWIGAGYRLDVAMSLHNLEWASHHPHLMCAIMSPERDRLHHAENLHAKITRRGEEEGFAVSGSVYGGNRGTVMPDILGGWLRSSYRTFFSMYEINSQAPHRHLSLEEVKRSGRVLLESTARYIYSDEAREMMREITEHREKRDSLWARYEPAGALHGRCVFDIENTLAMMPQVERAHLRHGVHSRWVLELNPELRQ